MLCNDENKKGKFPYIYIGGDIIENNFTATFHKGEPRYKALEHLKALFEKAKCICIYDEYLLMPDKKINGNWTYRNWRFFKIFCHKSLPKTPLKIRYIEIKPNTSNKPLYNLQSIRCDINNVCTKWNWQNVTEAHLKRLNLNYLHQYAHDRYLIVDNKIEIIFTSGIRYLMSKKKDFTYMVRLHRPR